MCAASRDGRESWTVTEEWVLRNEGQGISGNIQASTSIPAHPRLRTRSSYRVVVLYRIWHRFACRLQAAAGQSGQSMQSNLGTLASWLATDYCLQMPGILGDPHWPVGMLTNLTR